MDIEMLKCINQIKEISNEFGTFMLGDELGKGGTSIVRAAKLNGEGREFAIKFLAQDVGIRESRAYKRFKQAFLNLSAVQYVGCVLPLIHLGVTSIGDHKIPYQIMMKAESDLKRWIKGKKIDFAEFEKVFNSLLIGIETLHAHGIIHRDIKPENIFVVENRFLLGDFDIAKFDEDVNAVMVKTNSGERIGNYFFSAPEQADSNVGTVCAASDWYALAQVMIWLITGKTLRGLAHIDLRPGEAQYEKYNELFAVLLQENPAARLQTGRDIRDFLVRQDEESHLNQRRSNLFKSIRVFDKMIHKYCCQIRYSDIGVVKLDGRDEIDDLLNYFKANISSLNLYMVFEGRDFNVRDVDKVDGQVWSFDGHEISVGEIYVYKHFTSGGHMVVIRGDEMHAESPDARANGDYEEMARYNGHYVSRAEYDAGWAVIGGKRIDISDQAKLVGRFLKSKLYFISPQLCPLPERETFDLVSDIGRQYVQNGLVGEKLLLSKLKGKVHRTSFVRENF